ncbi:MAG: hypothetical protein J0I20_16605 [Chloroflexi bacterium]|nr:hypothetical protein [Chloroflexota bacterium]OJV88765.1 MAG: hypothetical protein BGO39_04490 [Chloroflexi bacterium 54-19]
MPKKTSRSARALQAQRTALTGERRTAARPLIDVNNSRLAVEAATDLDEATPDFEVVPEPKAAPVPEPVLTARTVSATGARPQSESRPTPVANGSNVIRPAGSRRPIARRTTTVVNRAPAISREEEYAFIRSDLLTVFILTVLMIIALVVLTFVIGR